MELLKGLGLGLAFGFILWNIIHNKKISFVSLVLFIFMSIVFCIEHFDQEYYTKQFGNIAHFDYYILGVTILMVLVSILELWLGFRKRLKQQEQEEEQNQAIEQVEQPIEEPIITKDEKYYFELMREPLAYFDEKENGYYLNQSMRKELQISSPFITINEMKEMMNDEDKINFSTNQKATSGEICYRLKASNGLTWFEEVHAVFNHQQYIVVRKNIGLNISLGSFKELNEKLEKKLDKNEDFYFMVLNLSDVDSKFSTEGQDFTNLCLAKYISKILNSSLKEGISLYHLSDFEYAILVEDVNFYELILRQLSEKKCELICQDVQINQIHSPIKGKLGIVHSKDVEEKSPRAIAQIAFEMVQKASSSSYQEDYSIYQKMAQPDETFTLEDLDINPETDLDSFKVDFPE